MVARGVRLFRTGPSTPGLRGRLPRLARYLGNHDFIAASGRTETIGARYAVNVMPVSSFGHDRKASPGHALIIAPDISLLDKDEADCSLPAGPIKYFHTGVSVVEAYSLTSVRAPMHDRMCFRSEADPRVCGGP